MNSWDCLTYSSDSQRLNLGDNISTAKHQSQILLLDLVAFNVHVRFAKGKGVDISGRVQVCQAVVNESVRGFVGSNSIDHV